MVYIHQFQGSTLTYKGPTSIYKTLMGIHDSGTYLGRLFSHNTNYGFLLDIYSFSSRFPKRTYISNTQKEKFK